MANGWMFTILSNTCWSWNIEDELLNVRNKKLFLVLTQGTLDDPMYVYIHNALNSFQSGHCFLVNSIS